ncbi:mycothiol synthase [Marihabitans asiaticum]|uniref:Mycothiol acetyltransferase n=1 Tax=Marihabitans asiaticum TaxID=415218 RepID=A0A560WHE4_9MICO|nr:mycothiol synthase [Marihabitans asiaticum]TWD16986.1 mycothiol synthase [Marihabitans asiaticum]
MTSPRTDRNEPRWHQALDHESADAVQALADDAAEHDGVAPLGEELVLGLRRPGRHLLAGERPPFAGYAGLTEDGTAEVVVAPGSRRSGVGRTLAESVLAAEPNARFWAHGDLPAAQGLAADLGLEQVRELRVLRRELAGVPDAPEPPPGYRVRTFVRGTDEEALLEVNAAAFADHPEQGRLDRAGFEERAQQPWFDPAGIFLVEDGEGGIAAFHWTKVADPPVGEVYVVGVHPKHQGRGLGGLATAVGLQHLRDRGLQTVELYVEGDNTPALATYERAGLTPFAVHAMYARPHGALPQ